MRRVTKEWVIELALRYGVDKKIIRDTLWPTAPTRSLAYLDTLKKMYVDMAITIADVIGCPLDELMRRPYNGGQVVQGNNNQIGNVNITNDTQALQNSIEAQKQIIDHQKKEIERLTDNMKQQLKTKDQQIDRLIKLAQDNGNQ